jgi:pyruvate, water dikinase
VALARRVERHFGCHQDIEWAIGHDGELFVVQSRPVTAAAKPAGPPAQPTAISLVMSRFGAVASEGGQASC